MRVIEDDVIIFDDETERMQHPAARLIPHSLWKSPNFFRGRLTPLNLDALTRPLDNFMQIDVTDERAAARSCILAIYLIRFPDASYKEIKSFAAQNQIYLFYNSIFLYIRCP